MDKFLRVRLFVIIVLLVAGSFVWLPTFSVGAETGDYLKVTFLDIGQGDAIHVETPDGYEMIIDGGATAGVLRELADERNYFDKDIDVMVATHPDTDHVGGLVDVLDRYEVGMILMTEVEGDSEAARAFARAAETEGAEVKIAEAGQTIQLGASTTIKIYSPYGDTTNWETNTASIVVQVSYGDIEFMLTGDAPSEIENYLASAYGDVLESEVLKLGHHGSKTSSSELFLETVTPDYAVVSAGVSNRYGHPAKEVLARASEAGAQILNTAEQGTIIFETDGREVWLDKKSHLAYNMI